MAVCGLKDIAPLLDSYISSSPFKCWLNYFSSTGFLDTTQGNIQISSCSNCDIAWLYKDAHRFGLDIYRDLVGDYNILCPRTNSGSALAVLNRQDSEFVDLMNSCPETGISRNKKPLLLPFYDVNHLFLSLYYKYYFNFFKMSLS